MNITKENIEKYEFIARMNVIYHERYERHFQKFINASNFLSIVLSSVAVATLGDVIVLPKEIVASILAMIIAVLNAAVLGFEMSNKKEVHRDLKRQWTGFQSFVFQKDVTLEQLEVAKNQINAMEPAPSRKRLIKAQELAADALSVRIVRNPSLWTRILILVGYLEKDSI